MRTASGCNHLQLMTDHERAGIEYAIECLESAQNNAAYFKAAHYRHSPRKTPLTNLKGDLQGALKELRQLAKHDDKRRRRRGELTWEEAHQPTTRELLEGIDYGR